MSLLEEAVVHAGMLVCQASHLGSDHSRNPWLGRHEPRHLWPHLCQGDAVLNSNVLGRLCLKIRKDEIWGRDVEQFLQLAIRLGPKRVVELLAAPVFSPCGYWSIVPSTKLKVQLLILLGRNCAADDVDFWDKGVRIGELPAPLRLQILCMTSACKNLTHIEYWS